MRSYKRILAVETSCDDTSVSIVRSDAWVEALCSANQDLVHRPFGGIVPEIASRNHTLNLLPLMEECLKKASLEWKDIEGLAVTSRPGLIGSLLVGLVTVKTLALTKDIPFIAVNHLEAHLLAPFLKDDQFSPPDDFKYPYLALAVSGGHTHLYEVKDLGVYKIMGHSLDDAAGEAFDKFAKMVGLGFPGGVKVDQTAKGGNPQAFDFPRALAKEENYHTSFSGLKAAALRKLQSMSKEEIQTRLSDLCASYQEAIVDALLIKLDRAVRLTGLNKVTISGGVSANSRLREKAQAWAEEKNVRLVIPPIRYCTDNAAMVGLVGIERLNRGEVSSQAESPSAQSLPGDFQ